MKRFYFILVLSIIYLLGFAKNQLTKNSIYESLQRVADWQLLHFEEQVKTGSIYENSHAYWTWTNGAMYMGMLDWAKLSNNKKYLQFLKSVGEKTAFKPISNLFHADDICVSQLYLELYSIYKDSDMIKPTLDRMNFVLNNRSAGDLNYLRKGSEKRWTWCDALFMAPQVYALA